MTETRWIMRQTDADLPLMARTLGISEIAAAVMAHRGVRSKNAALRFLAPTIDKMHDTGLFKDMDLALGVVSGAVGRGDKIVIYGDYDADGIMSTVILYKALRHLGADCEYYIPNRVDEGYGLNMDAVEKLAAGGAKLLITVDNGISAGAEIARAAELGVGVVIIDHHEPPKDGLPPAIAIIDPLQEGCGYPFKEMCAAGLVYKFVMRLCEGKPMPQGLCDEMLVFAAIATLCDIVSLTGENRVIVTEGLRVLNGDKLINPGLGSLIALRGYLGKPIDPYVVGFVLGPCINATGRLGSADMAVELLLLGQGEKERRFALAQELAELNESRKNMTAECVERALASLGEPLPDVLVLTDLDAHESIAGIVAGRVREAANRPCIMLTMGDGAMKGSARSIDEYNIYEALYELRHLFTRFGGHAMAAGLTLPEGNIDTLRRCLNENCTLTEEDFAKKLYIDCELQPAQITLALAGELGRLAPYGKGNPAPLFVCRNLYVENVRVIDEKNTLIFTFVADGRQPLKGIAFKLNELYHDKANAAGVKKHGGFNMDIVFAVEINEWNGKTEVQVAVKDFAIE